MKKVYIAPQIEVCIMSQQQYMLTGSLEGKTVEGGPTGTNGIPGDVTNTSDSDGSEYSGTGGNRAPGFFGGFDE